MRLQRAAEVAFGVHVTQSSADLGVEWADALAFHEDQVEDLHLDQNFARREARTLGRGGRPPDAVELT